MSLLFNKLSMKGLIMHLNAFGQLLIILNTHKAMADLLECWAAIYSDQPQSIIAYEMMTSR